MMDKISLEIDYSSTEPKPVAHDLMMAVEGVNESASDFYSLIERRTEAGGSQELKFEEARRHIKNLENDLEALKGWTKAAFDRKRI